MEQQEVNEQMMEKLQANSKGKKSKGIEQVTTKSYIVALYNITYIINLTTFCSLF